MMLALVYALRCWGLDMLVNCLGSALRRAPEIQSANKITETLTGVSKRP